MSSESSQSRKKSCTEGKIKRKVLEEMKQCILKVEGIRLSSLTHEKEDHERLRGGRDGIQL